MTSLRRRPAMLAAGVLLSVLLAACGSSSSGGDAAPDGNATGNSGDTNANPTVSIKGFKFSPATINVKVGTKVTFIQEDSTPHNATAKGANSFQTPNLNQGQKYTVTFTKAGTYSYICTLHPSIMKGTVVVS